MQAYPSTFTRAQAPMLVGLCALMLCAVLVGIFPATGGAATFQVRPSLEQVAVTHAPVGAPVALRDQAGTVVQSATADRLGSALFRGVVPGTGYRVAVGAELSDPFAVNPVAGSTPPQAFYEGQDLQPGFNYIETRDGTTLSAWVFLPGPVEDGPYPTVVEYSGYDPSRPPTSGLSDFGIELPDDLAGVLCSQVAVLCDLPSQPGSIFAGALGYAVVAVNIRGTGCSGGAFDFFEPLQRLDGYDVIETVATQSWAKEGRVGMVGLSYPGISQLYVASTRPPHLAAIAPFSVYDDVARGITAPGAMYNTGFAGEWIEQVLRRARPYGQGWERGRVNAGDTTCAENQLLRYQNVDNTEVASSQEFYDPALVDPLNPYLFVKDIDVPVLMAGAWQDEQTGGRFSTLWDRFLSAPFTRFIGYNGLHPDGYSPDILAELDAFLDFFVAEKRTAMNPILLIAMPLVMEQFLGTPVAPPKQNWLSGRFDDLKARYLDQPQVRIIYDRGRSIFAGSPSGGLSVEYDSWPVASEMAAWYLAPDGRLTTAPPLNTTGAAAFMVDVSEAGRRVESDLDEWFPKPGWHWTQEDPGEALTFTSEPLSAYTAFLGSGSVDLWIRSDVVDAFLEVTVSEIDRLGNEIYVQSGWLRAQTRALAAEAREDWPQITGLESDAAPLVPGEWTPVRVEVFPFGHIFQKGSRLRLTVDNPGESRPSWTFRTDPSLDGSTVEVAYSSQFPSRLVLNRVGGIPEFLPFRSDCTYLRGQYCRESVDFQNTVVANAYFPPTTTTTASPTTTVAPSSTTSSTHASSTSPTSSSTRPNTVTPTTASTVGPRSDTATRDRSTRTAAQDADRSGHASNPQNGLSPSPHSPTDQSVDGAHDRSVVTPADENGPTARGGQGTNQVENPTAGAPLTASAASPRQPAVRQDLAANTTPSNSTPVSSRDSGGAPLARTGGSIAVLLAVAGIALLGGALASRKVRTSRQ
ncbi:MAG: CocE/NonD family hydrolase [Acidimicrobiia bacterium]|nr:CocE/NonD family hydrolase [Acidimicrobiia bacterium]MBP8181234.1 CocE/NonD family hydrolase [Acidimicrobiia bacterium]